MPKSLPDMMHAVTGPEAPPVAPASAPPTASPVPRQPGTYVRSNGHAVPISGMAGAHRAAAAAKARHAGDHALADELEGKE